MEEKVLNLLHLARKAGKLKYGFDPVERSCFRGDSKLVIYTDDISERSKKKLLNMTYAYNIKAVEFGTKELLGESFKMRDIGIISIDDSNFAKGIIDILR